MQSLAFSPLVCQVEVCSSEGPRIIRHSEHDSCRPFLNEQFGGQGRDLIFEMALERALCGTIKASAGRTGSVCCVLS